MLSTLDLAFSAPHTVTVKKPTKITYTYIFPRFTYIEFFDMHVGTKNTIKPE